MDPVRIVNKQKIHTVVVVVIYCTFQNVYSSHFTTFLLPTRFAGVVVAVDHLPETEFDMIGVVVVVVIAVDDDVVVNM